jgi:multicomponent Na+:H+ antiporter subunit F
MVESVFPFLLIVVLLLTLPFLGRVVAGPTVYDRVVGLNAVGSMVPLILVLVGLLYGRVENFVDLALALFLLNLFTTLLVARYAREKEKKREEKEGA